MHDPAIAPETLRAELNAIAEQALRVESYSSTIAPNGSRMIRASAAP